MAAASEKASSCCSDPSSCPPIRVGDKKRSASPVALIRPVPDIPEPSAKPPTTKAGPQVMTRVQTSHPLDPLSAAEISVAVSTVRAAGATPEVRDSMRFIEVVLLEPDKIIVALADAYFFPPFQPSLLPRSKGGPAIPSKLPPRRARLVVYNKQSNATSTWVVELSEVHAATRGGHHRGKVISSEVVPDVQPPMDAVEYAECEAVVKDYPPFVEAMKKRGIEDMDLVMVDPWCIGYYSEADAPSRRLAKALVFCRTESDCPLENGYARPVEGIFVLVDMQNMVVVEFEDRKFVPLPPADPLRNYTSGETRGGVDRSDVKPLHISQPEGPSFRVNGYYVEWQKWNFRIGFTPREGLVIHSVAYVDGSRGRRPVAHRLCFVEMVVPYGDPNDPHYRKNAFDAGEDGLGKNAHSLKRGCDCLGYIKYFDAHFTNFTGGVETIENCVCLHEEDHGILWKHQDWRTGLAEVRRSRRLTVSFICTVANYEYGFYWHFYQDGKIEAEVKLTGILSVGALQPGETRKYGTMIAPGLYAPAHQHFFIARMNMSVDSKPSEGLNQVVEVNVKVEEPGQTNFHDNAFYPEEELLRSEMQAMRDCNPLSARHWIVRNTRTVNRTGQPTGYKLVPGSNCLPLAGPGAKFLRRAAFLKHNLWVTQYKNDELYPGGEFPNQNPRINEGLATWVKQNRSLEEADIVLWYVFGITHIPRLEDWPVMPVELIGFTLMPHGFFNCSPAAQINSTQPNPTMTLPLPSLDSSPAFLLLSAAASDDLPTLKSTLKSHSNLSPNTTSLWYHRSFGSPSMAFHHRTPLMVAALHSSTSVLAFLLSLPSLHLDLPSPSDSSTALHCAAAVGDSTSLKLLLSSGADPSVPNSSGLLPLHLLPRLRSSQLSPLLGGKEIKKEKEYPVDVTLPDIKSGIFVSDEFRMYSFKVRVCTRAYSHDWTECPFVHPGENARRRDPRKYSYSCVPCLEFRKGSCRNGDACEYAHGVFESWLHPSQYRTRLCKDETSCSRRVCFFAHKPEELRAPVDQTFEIETSSPRKALALPPLQTGSPVWMDRIGLGTPARSRLNSTVSARDFELNEFQQKLLDEIRRESDYAEILRNSSSGFVHPSSPKMAPSAMTRAAAFAKRSQSFIDRGAVGRVASRQASNWGSPNGNCEWASPNGKLDWGIQGEEINKLRKSASFGIRSAAAPPGFSRGPTGEPDVSWVQSVLKDGPEFEPRRISNRNHQYGEMFPSWADQLYMEQEQMVA